MKTVTKILSVAIMVTLTACGSSGSADDGPTVKIADQTDRVPKDYKWNPNEIIIDGKETIFIDISNLNRETNSYEFTEINNYSTELNGKYVKIDTLILSPTKLENSLFGLIYRGTHVNTFTNGDKTKNMPKGTANYEVGAVVADLNFANKVTIVNSAKIYVDFDNKSVKGEIDNISINAKISNNLFKQESKDVTAGGFFYGDKAQEIGGFYLDHRFNKLGAFGGTKK